MKKLLLLILFFLYFVVINAQTYKLDSTYHFSWNTASWHHNIKEVYTYTNNGTKETNVIRLTKNGSNWVNYYQYTKSYDANNDLILNLFQNWNTGNLVWDDTSKKTHNLDSNQNEIEYEETLYYNATWNPYKKRNASYTSQGIVEKTEQNYNASITAYENKDKFEYFYNASNQLIQLTQSRWIDYLNAWEHEEKINYSYTNNLVSQKNVTRFHIGNNAWNTHPITQYNYTYDVDNNRIDKTELLWNASTSQLRNYRQTLHTYSSNNRIETTRKEWHTATAIWNNKFRELTTYDSNNYKTEFILQTFDASITDWENYQKTTYFWALATAVTLQLKENELTNIVVYPNPTKSVINIELETFLIEKMNLIIFDNFGKKIQESTINVTGNTLQFSLENYKSGLYFLKLYTNTTSKIVKIIKL